MRLRLRCIGNCQKGSILFIMRYFLSLVSTIDIILCSYVYIAIDVYGVSQYVELSPGRVQYH